MANDPDKMYADIIDHDPCNIKYSKNTITNVEIVCIISLLLWVVLIVVLGLVRDDFIMLLLLLIPPIVFLINFWSVDDFTCATENQMLRGNFLSVAFLVAIILINWNTPVSNHNKTEFFKILITAFILLMISLVDLWVDEETMSVIKHIKTSLNTASVILLAIALYLYYQCHYGMVYNTST